MEWWQTLIVSSVLALLGNITLIFQLRKTHAEARYTEANTSEKYEMVARNAAESILEKTDRISKLEKVVQEMQESINRLEQERVRLTKKNMLLERRVKMLEDVLNAHDIPIPSSNFEEIM